MTIISEIFQAMHEVEMQPIGLKFGISARYAFDADCHITRREGLPEKIEQLRAVLPLSRSWTIEFQGWSFIFGDSPNPLHGQRRNAA